MLLFDLPALPDQVRHCTWCCEPFEPTSANFGRCRTGRHGLMTVCKHCRAHDAKLRRRYRDEFDEPLACACGYEGKLEVDHSHTDYPFPFRAWRCRRVVSYRSLECWPESTRSLLRQLLDETLSGYSSNFLWQWLSGMEPCMFLDSAVPGSSIL